MAQCRSSVRAPATMIGVMSGPYTTSHERLRLWTGAGGPYAPCFPELAGSSSYLTFTYDLFHWQNLGQIFTDSHFVERNRMGRLMTFLARQIQDGKASAAYGLGIE